MMKYDNLMIECIYIEYRQKILRYVRSKISSPQEAEDICSAVMIKIINGLPGFDSSKSSLNTWIYTITRNALTDYYRRYRIHEPLEEEIVYSENGFDEILREEMLEELAEALEKLPQREKDIIILHYYSGITLKEIAVSMGMSYSNLKNVHHRALSHLRRQMDFA